MIFCKFDFRQNFTLASNFYILKTAWPSHFTYSNLRMQLLHWKYISCYKETPLVCRSHLRLLWAISLRVRQGLFWQQSSSLTNNISDLNKKVQRHFYLTFNLKKNKFQHENLSSTLSKGWGIENNIILLSHKWYSLKFLWEVLIVTFKAW